MAILIKSTHSARRFKIYAYIYIYIYTVESQGGFSTTLGWKISKILQGGFFNTPLGGFFNTHLGGFFNSHLGGFLNSNLGGFFNSPLGGFFNSRKGGFFYLKVVILDFQPY